MEILTPWFWFPWSICSAIKLFKWHITSERRSSLSTKIYFGVQQIVIALTGIQLETMLISNSRLDSEFSSRELKVLFCSYYGNKLRLSSTYGANRSSVVFFDTLTPEDMVDTNPSADPFISGTNIIWQALMREDFLLQDRFSESAWPQQIIEEHHFPSTPLNFLKVLLKVDPKQHHRSLSDEGINYECDGEEEDEQVS